MSAYSAYGQGMVGQPRRLTKLLGFGGPAGGSGRSLVPGGARYGAPPALGSATGQSASVVTDPPVQTNTTTRERPQEANGPGFTGYQSGIDQAQKGPGYGPAGTRRALRQMQAGNAFRANELYWPMLQQLMQQSDPENLAATYAPEYERVNDQYDQAQGTLDRAMAARGLTDSSMMAGSMGALAGSRAQATSNLGAQISQEARNRGDLLRTTLYQLLTGNASAAGGLANQAIQDKLTRQQMQGAGFLETLLPMLGQAATAYLGAPR